MGNALENLILRRGGAEAAMCIVPALSIAAQPLADVARFRALCPRVVVGQTVGAGHFNNRLVPERVNAMIERFLTTTAPSSPPKPERALAFRPPASAPACSRSGPLVRPPRKAQTRRRAGQASPEDTDHMGVRSMADA
jgi:hypothetical protein